MAHRLAARYAKIYPRFRDDLYEAAESGAIKAAFTYASVAPWEFWVRRCIVWGLNHAVTELKTSATPDMGLSGSGEAHDEAGALDDRLAVLERHDHVRALVELLDEVHQNVVKKLYFDGQSIAALALDMHVTRKRCQQLHREALATMRNHQ